MLYKLERQGEPMEFYWRHGAGPLRQLGTYGEVAEMAYRIVDILTFGNFAAIPDLPELPPEAAPCYTVPEAVSAAQGLDADKRRLGVTIRSAARHGRIAGAYRTPEGYWRLPIAAFIAWLAEHAEHRRGRPRKATAADLRMHTWDDTTPTVNVDGPEYQRIDPLIADANEGTA